MRLTLITILVFLLTTNTWAGSNFTELSKTVEIVDWDKWVKERDKALEYEKKVKGAYVFTSSTTIQRWHP